jgi:transcriptional regulator with XRE-family HTH domain
MAKETFGQHLADIRNRANISQEEVARLTRINVGLIDWFEKDRIIPNRKQVHAICRAINCSSFWLLKWRENSLRYRRIFRDSTKRA